MGCEIEVWVLVPPTGDAAVHADRILSRYDRARPVRRWREECPCIGAAAEAQVTARLAAEHVDLHAELDALPGQGILLERLAAEREARLCLARARIVPRPDCAECQGGGQVERTANPEGRIAHWRLDGGVMTARAVLADLAHGPGFALPERVVDHEGTWREFLILFQTAPEEISAWSVQVAALLAQHSAWRVARLHCRT